MGFRFNFGGEQGEPETPKGESVGVELEVTLKDLYLGAHYKVSRRASTCGSCTACGAGEIKRREHGRGAGSRIEGPLPGSAVQGAQCKGGPEGA